MPAGQADDQGTDQRRQHRADIAAAIEDTGSQRSITHRKPSGDRLDAGREVAAFAEAEHDAGDDEAGDGGDHAVRGGSKAPQDRRGGKAEADADLVGEPPHSSVANCIGNRKEEDDVAEIGFAEMQVVLDRRLKHAEDVTVHIVDGGDDEQKCADNPAVVSGSLGEGWQVRLFHEDPPGLRSFESRCSW